MPAKVFSDSMHSYMQSRYDDWNKVKRGTSHIEVARSIANGLFKKFESLPDDGCNGEWPEWLKEKRVKVRPKPVMFTHQKRANF
jgi:hypothetical protein